MLVAVGDLVLDTSVRILAEQIDPSSDTPAQIVQGRGGSAANVVAVSRRLGRPARFIGARGRDASGQWLQEQLSALGAELDGPITERPPSIVVLIDTDGQRRFLTDRGPATTWHADPGQWLAGADRLHVTGYALCDDDSTGACRELAAEASRRGIPISIDPSSTSLLQSFGPDRFAALVLEIGPDVLLPNTDEARLLGGPDALVGLLGQHGRWVVITDGPAPTTLVGAGGTTSHHLVPDGAADAAEAAGAPGAVVDTTGAGDAFAAGFLRALDRGVPATAALDAGHAAARRVIGAVGADAWDAASS